MWPVFAWVPELSQGRGEGVVGSVSLLRRGGERARAGGRGRPAPRERERQRGEGTGEDGEHTHWGAMFKSNKIVISLGLPAHQLMHSTNQFVFRRLYLRECLNVVRLGCSLKSSALFQALGKAKSVNFLNCSVLGRMRS